MKKSKLTTQVITMIALAIVMNYIGGQIALAFKLPIFLDSIGTLMVASMFGPIIGMLPPLVSGLLGTITGDIFALYFLPVGLIIGFMGGIVLKKMRPYGWWIIPAAFLITLPGTIVSSAINAILFGGITSSGNTVLIQILARTPLGLTGAVVVVQVLFDFLDRLLSVFLVVTLQMVPMIRQQMIQVRAK